MANTTIDGKQVSIEGAWQWQRHNRQGDVDLPQLVLL